GPGAQRLARAGGTARAAASADLSRPPGRAGDLHPSLPSGRSVSLPRPGELAGAALLLGDDGAGIRCGVTLDDGGVHPPGRRHRGVPGCARGSYVGGPPVLPRRAPPPPPCPPPPCSTPPPKPPPSAATSPRGCTSRTATSSTR